VPRTIAVRLSNVQLDTAALPRRGSPRVNSPGAARASKRRRDFIVTKLQKIWREMRFAQLSTILVRMCQHVYPNCDNADYLTVNGACGCGELR
jgi:hypothetical protein